MRRDFVGIKSCQKHDLKKPPSNNIKKEGSIEIRVLLFLIIVRKTNGR